ncbi:hypothetical protein DXI23_03725 [Marinobacter flavimaris]|uniref:Uncharacterized protein n=1 Tax=Marinobacter flavimaris TaxID=262076 RepID=A0A3D8H7S7_9GAMM|nr:hypothetical protein MDHKLMBL_14510 [Marinobacter flavimaris]RDU42784.1 hypothetical protein DXI23_03725 [Marinobacter flavimaris]
MNIERVDGSLIIGTAEVDYKLQAHSLAWDSINTADRASQTKVLLKDEDHRACEFISSENWEVIEAGPVSITVKQDGVWKKSDGSDHVRVTCELAIYSANGLMEVSVTPHNPRRASHPGGLWDLGDRGSVFFRGLNVETTFSQEGHITLISGEPETSKTVTSNQSAGIYQDSSGGTHWDSPNHVDRFGKITTRFRGYSISKDGQAISSGLRANPRLIWESDKTSLQIAVPRFWQNFPTSVCGEQRKVVAGLFPEDSGQLYELQGGERKRQTLFIDHSERKDDLSWVYAPLTPVLDASVYEASDAFPWFQANQPKGPLDELINQGLEGPYNFFQKREQIDEYGWRNFGDIFADHETLYQPEGEPPLVSHYNNQYDAIYGFARQFALTGDSRWFELMDDLARHVVDIDIYHTNEDRAEYNHGLFWHTDHYLPAHTATHRTFTRHNDTSSTPGQTGGGPAAEHCYTTGLLYHYLMTGQADSRAAVLDLTQWMVNLHDGSRGLLAQLLAVKKQEVPKLKALVRGEQPSTHRYPFTRGTGNYLTALMDAAILEPHNGWLEKASQVMRDTIHPGDDIGARNLLDVEIGWSYLILLSAMARFLKLKRQYQEIDASYLYTREAFLKYTAWMQTNESPFLQEPEQLEFANDTWVAQDIRKAMLLFNAAELSQGDEAADYRHTAQTWLEQACNTLANSPEKHFSRILIILAQNYAQHSETEAPHSDVDKATAPIHAAGDPLLTWPQLIARIVQRISLGITQFRPAREKAWLDARMNR